jgi:hypothetical protein
LHYIALVFLVFSFFEGRFTPIHRDLVRFTPMLMKAGMKGEATKVAFKSWTGQKCQKADPAMVSSYRRLSCASRKRGKLQKIGTEKREDGITD